MHVHVQHEKGEAKVWIEPEIEPAESYGLSRGQVRSPCVSFGSTKMKSALRGRGTSDVEVTNISAHGLWLWLGDREVFLAYEVFPWFKEAPVGDVLNVERVTPDHLYWPDLDIDLHVESLDEPEKYSLVSRARPNKRMQPPRASGHPRRGRRKARG